MLSLKGFVDGAISFFTPDFNEIYLTDEDIVKLNNAGKRDLYEGHANGEIVIKLEKDLKCKAFKGGSCSINDIKPTMCKAFPFYIDMFGGLALVGDTCEGVGYGWTDATDFKGEVEACIKMYEYWLKLIKADKDDVKKLLHMHKNNINV